MSSKFAFQVFTVSVQALTLLVLGLGILTLGAESAVAREPSRQRSLANPLELTEVDPLIPEAVWQGEVGLTEAQRGGLAMTLDQLNVEAMAAFSEGRVSEAFELWNRELRLRRFLGTQAELEALQRVGQLAWDQEEFYQLQVIRERLRRIQRQELEEVERPNLERLLALAQTYETVGARSAALEVYEAVLEWARSQGDEAQQEEAWQRLGETALQDLNYEAAASAYEALRELARQRGRSRAGGGLFEGVGLYLRSPPGL